ncbi:unnamed protein product, partial [Mycena citricolor]
RSKIETEIDTSCLAKSSLIKIIYVLCSLVGAKFPEIRSREDPVSRLLTQVLSSSRRARARTSRWSTRSGSPRRVQKAGSPSYTYSIVISP